MSLAQLHPMSYEVLHPGALEPGRYLTDGRRLFRVVSRFTVPPETVLVALEACATFAHHRSRSERARTDGPQRSPDGGPGLTRRAGPQLWRYQPPLPGLWALDDVSKLPALEQIADQLVQSYAGELERLADMLIEAGPVPA